MTEDKATIEIDRIDGSCPVQAMGTINDHSSFYFRGRHEAWQFVAGPKELDTDSLVKVLIGVSEDPRVFVLRGDDEERLYLDYDHVRDVLPCRARVPLALAMGVNGSSFWSGAKGPRRRVRSTKNRGQIGPKTP